MQEEEIKFTENHVQSGILFLLVTQIPRNTETFSLLLHPSTRTYENICMNVSLQLKHSMAYASDEKMNETKWK